jgi:ABC-type transporter Mla subunit MlaD
MSRIARSSRPLLAAAALLFAAGVGTWLATGRHVGWTQTSTVTMQRDEITGIDFPVRQEAFIAGVEIPLAASAGAAALAALAWFLSRRRPAPA